LPLVSRVWGAFVEWSSDHLNEKRGRSPESDTKRRTNKKQN
ncbi:6650_t:CDS:1, partial [Acaulospora morrowiae]